MSRRILVDGYNLLFAIGKTPHQADRTYILDQLAGYSSGKNVAVTVVFDRKTGNPAEGRQLLARKGVRVIFTAPRQEADEVIRRMAASSERPRDVLVVSSDKGISRYCAGLGAEVMPSEQFAAFLAKRRVSRQDIPVDEQKPLPRHEDTEYYLRRFLEEK